VAVCQDDGDVAGDVVYTFFNIVDEQFFSSKNFSHYEKKNVHNTSPATSPSSWQTATTVLLAIAFLSSSCCCPIFFLPACSLNKACPVTDQGSPCCDHYLSRNWIKKSGCGIFVVAPCLISTSIGS